MLNVSFLNERFRFSFLVVIVAINEMTYFACFSKSILSFVFVSLGSATEERNEETEQFQ